VNKPKLIIFEGMDRTGKTTLMKKVWNLRGQIDCCVDRFIISNIVYNEYYERKIDDTNYALFLPDTLNTVIIYINATYSDYKQRAISTKEDYMNYDNWCVQKKLFEHAMTNVRKYLKKGRVITINNHNGIDIDVLTQIIINEIGD